MRRAWLERRLGPTEVEELLEAILSGDVEICERLLGRLLCSFSVHDLSGRRPSKKRVAEAGEGTTGDPEYELSLTPEQIPCYSPPWSMFHRLSYLG